MLLCTILIEHKDQQYSLSDIVLVGLSQDAAKVLGGEDLHISFFLTILTGTLLQPSRARHCKTQVLHFGECSCVSVF